MEQLNLFDKTEQETELEEKLAWEQRRTKVFEAVAEYHSAYGFDHTLNLLTSLIATVYQCNDLEADGERSA